MGDCIKDLTIIDYLGIAVPGCILVLMISGNNEELYFWGNYFGSDTSAFVKGIFLLVSGYLAGMLLHELGDILEKGVWCASLLDPKAYAASVVGPEMICQAARKVGMDIIEEETSTLKCIGGAIGIVVVLFFATTGLCCVMDKVSGEEYIGRRAHISTILFLAACIGICIVMGYRLKQKMKGHKDIQHVRCLNSQIQTYITYHIKNGKLAIFDSFRHVMRNIVICIAVVNAYSIWRPVALYVKVGRALVDEGNAEQNMLWLSIWFSVLIYAAFIRYNHYAFLRYKYSYESFLVHVGETEKERTKVRIVKRR